MPLDVTVEEPRAWVVGNYSGAKVSGLRKSRIIFCPPQRRGRASLDLDGVPVERVLQVCGRDHRWVAGSEIGRARHDLELVTMDMAARFISAPSRERTEDTLTKDGLLNRRS
jgi:hypothetical protein